MLYAIVGDIHGEIDCLLMLMRRLPQVDRLIFVGDYVDRGPACLTVLRYLDEVRATRHAILLRGNHEEKHRKMWSTGRRHRIPDDCRTEEDYADFQRLVQTLDTCYYRDEHLLVTHAPCMLWQHDLVKESLMLYGKTMDGPDGLYGLVSERYGMMPGETCKKVRSRMGLSQWYPNEISQKPVFFGHVHAGGLHLERDHEYCVDYSCGSGGPLGAMVVEVVDGHARIKDTILAGP